MKNFTSSKSSLKKFIQITCITFFATYSSFAQTGLEFIPVEDSEIQWADYNNDTYLDVLVSGVSDYEGTVTKLYKNNGDGTFTEQTQIELTGVRWGAVAWGDYNNDTHLDILLTGVPSESDSYSPISKIYKNNGDGTFTEQTQIVLPGVFKGSVEWGDFNNDTYPDILLMGRQSDDSPLTKIYRNNGDGTFTDINADLTNSMHGSVSWGDYNNDGFIDILLIGAYSGCKVYRNNGDETFTEQITLIGSIDESSACWGDYDNDGFLDILITGQKSGLLNSKIYKNNNGDGTFTDINADLPIVESGAAKWGDYDKDGFVDILLTGSGSSGRISKIYKNNNGDGTFTEETQIELPGIRSSSVAWGDYNNDTYLDFIISGESDNSKVTKLYTNNQSSGFVSGDIPYYGQFFTFDDIMPVSDVTIATGDCNNDTYPDILLCGHNINHYCKIYKNNGNGTFTDINVDIQQPMEGTAAWGDYNNDNYLDILITGSYLPGGKQSKVYKNNGPPFGGFTEQTQIVLDGASRGSPTWIDYNKDTDIDIIISGHTGDYSKIYKNNGDETFTENTSAVLHGETDGALIWCDFNNDTYPDILIAGNDNTILYKNNGDETFTDINAGLPGVTHSSAAWGDYNNDNYPDILLTGFYDGSRISRVYKNNGNETFEEQTLIELTGVFAGSVAWFDYNNDNYLDILLTGLTNDLIFISKIYKNNNNETFTEQTNINLEGVLYSDVQCADYNNDGFQDILIGGLNNFYVDIFTLYANTGTGNFEKIDYNFPDLTNSFVSVADFDKNGYPDMFITGENNASQQINEIYQTVKFGFRKTDISIPVLTDASSSWGDYNNDGFLDIIICGKNDLGTPVTKLFRNSTSGKFIETFIPFQGIYNANIDWADYNNDGRLDFVICGTTSAGNLITKIYENTGDNFVETSAVIPGAVFVKWGDFNNDNLYDLVISDYENHTKVYQNKGDDEFELSYYHVNTYKSSKDLSFTDYNYDGYTDILVLKEGASSYYGHKLLYHKNNRDGTFSEPVIFSIGGYNSVYKNNLLVQDFDADGKPDIILNNDIINETNFISIYSNDTIALSNPVSISGVSDGSIAWTDFDNDGDLDFFTTGNLSNDTIGRVFYNNGTEQNRTPEIPTDLGFSCNTDTVFISWNAATDNETSTQTLTYNCYMYEIGGDTIWHSMSNHTTGKRYIEKLGNTGHNTSWFITGLEVEKEYAWSVQTIDNGLMASAFADEITFRLAPEFILQPVKQTVCENRDAIFSITTTECDSVRWQVNENDGSGFKIIKNNDIYSGASNPNLMLNSILLEMNNYQYRCLAYTIGGEAISKIDTLFVDDFIEANAGIDTFACDITQAQLSANLPENTSGFWTCENTSVTFENETDPNTTVFNLFEESITSIEWTLIQQNTCGQNSNDVNITQYLSYTIYPIPPNPTGDIELCYGISGNYQTDGIGYANSYLWEITPPDAGNITNDSIQTTINWSADYSGLASVRYKAQNECNYGEWSPSINVNIKSYPQKTDSPEGKTDICINGLSSYIVNTVPYANSYSWQIYPDTAGVITGNTSQITAQWQNDFSGETYIKVKAINECGESEFSDSLKIILNKPTVSNIIEKSKTMLVGVDSGYTYQWYRDGEAISGANKQYYYNENMPAGDYQVEIIDLKNCNSISDIYTFGSNTKNIELAETISIYPNPTNGKFTIEIINNYTGKIDYKITNTLGQIILQNSINKENNYLKIEKDLLNLQTGIYNIEFIFNNEKIVKQLIIN